MATALPRTELDLTDRSSSVRQCHLLLLSFHSTLIQIMYLIKSQVFIRETIQIKIPQGYCQLFLNQYQY